MILVFQFSEVLSIIEIIWTDHLNYLNSDLVLISFLRLLVLIISFIKFICVAFLSNFPIRGHRHLQCFIIIQTKSVKKAILGICRFSCFFSLFCRFERVIIKLYIVLFLILFQRYLVGPVDDLLMFHFSSWCSELFRIISEYILGLLQPFFWRMISFRFLWDIFIHSALAKTDFIKMIVLSQSISRNHAIFSCAILHRSLNVCKYSFLICIEILS